VTPWLGALVVVLTLALSTGGGWLATRLVLHVASRSPDAGGTTRARGAAGASSDAATLPASAPHGTDASPHGTDAVTNGPDSLRPGQARAVADGAAAGSDSHAPDLDGPEGAGALEALRGGTWIGLLERLATTGALLYGEPTAIAVVVAVKGLGRYPELREHPAASERFVIGSLASLTWAAGVGIVGRWLLTR
jgi:hypothetical protein